MIIRNTGHRNAIKERLLQSLKAERAFWSYDEGSVSLDTVSDDQLIALTMRHLDLEDISLLFDIYPKDKVKSAWRRLLVPEGEYLYTLNRFFAWYYFKAKKPDTYLRSMETRHFNQLSLS